MTPNLVATSEDTAKRSAPQPQRRAALPPLLVRAAAAVAPWIALVVLWYLVRLSGLVKPSLVPTPADVLTKLWHLIVAQGLLFDAWESTMRVLAGLACGIVLAVPVGFVLGWYRGLGRFLDPLVNFFRALPPIALIPLVIVYFGIGEVAKIAILFYAAFFAGVIVMYEGIRQTSPLYVRVARTLGATDSEIFLRVIVPLSLPHVLTALRVALGVTWATLVAAELVAAQRGLGAVIQNASNYFQISTIYAGIVCIGAIALLMDATVRAASARLVSWQERVTR
ncbi:MAG TPA: ABC transporter permease [Candidatus Baltobacteraceae bacterium]|nr:ABC transporter permease [Candidatus Baltobacteraceae bacterium]